RFVPTIKIVNPPTGVDLSNGLSQHGPPVGGIIPATAEEQALLGAADLRTAANDDIELYYVNFLNDGSGTGFRGESFPKVGVTDAAYADSAIINTRDKRLFTVAHEIGHVLADDGEHFAETFAEFILMMSQGTSVAC